MKKSLKKSEIERFSRQIILKDIGSAGQEKIKKAKILIVGAGGLGCPVV
jgi:molybdopterin/thiamine biosynthesis adenylyltransferase